MGKSTMIESSSRVVEIKDFDEDVIEGLLYYMYTGTMKDLKNVDVEALMCAADKYQLEHLKTMCEDILCSRISLENAASLLVMADLQRVEKLKEKVLGFIVRNPRVMLTKEWNEVVVSQSSDLIKSVFAAIAKNSSK